MASTPSTAVERFDAELTALDQDRTGAYSPDAMSFRQMLFVAEQMAASGWFADVGSAQQALVKVLAGKEMGVPPFEAMSDIDIVKGRPRLRSRLLAKMVRQHPRYDYRVIARTDEVCVLSFSMDGEELEPLIEFRFEEAKRAHLVKAEGAWTTYPSDMCFARAMSRGVRTHCPDVTSGSALVEGEEAETEEPSLEERQQKAAEINDAATEKARGLRGRRRAAPPAEPAPEAQEPEAAAPAPDEPDPPPPAAENAVGASGGQEDLFDPDAGEGEILDGDVIPD